MNIEVEQTIAREILSKLKILDPLCILAGGAPRDWYFGRSASDLDFYVECSQFTTMLQQIGQLEALFGKTFAPVGASQQELYVSNPSIVRVLESNLLGKIVQVIFCEKRDTVTENFPFGICKAYMTSNGRLVYPEQFREEVKYGTLVLRNILYKQGDKFLSKMRSYFPDYKYYTSEVQFYKDIVNGKLKGSNHDS